MTQDGELYTTYFDGMKNAQMNYGHRTQIFMFLHLFTDLFRKNLSPLFRRNKQLILTSNF